MCRILLYVGSEVIEPWSLVAARYKKGKGRPVFSLSREEQLHGFGVAWSAAGRSAGCVVTLEPPLTDLNTRRVCAATRGNIVLAHLRSCRCSTCPATTYCPSAQNNAQPFVRGRLMFTHCGILWHHRDLMRCSGEASDRAKSAGDLDAGNSDSAFLFRIFASYFDEGVGVECALRSTLALVSTGAPRPCSLNLVATDGETTVFCRHRSPGDDGAPPPLFVQSGEGSVVAASAPVNWGEGEFVELAPDGVCVFEGGALHIGAPVAVAPAAAAAPPEPRVVEVPLPLVPIERLCRGEVLARAESALREVVRRSVAAAGTRKKEVGSALAVNKKLIFGALRRDVAMDSVRDSTAADALVAAAVEALEAAVALSVIDKASAPKKSGGGGAGKACWNCGGTGHLSRDCPEEPNPDAQQAAPRRGRGPKCYNCGEFGHISRECPDADSGPKCYNCMEFGHIAAACPQPKADGGPLGDL